MSIAERDLPRVPAEVGRRAGNSGTVVPVRGSVVDIRFDGHLPSIHSLLHAGAAHGIVIEVLAQRDARHVRGIALTPTQGLARGMAVVDTRGLLKAPVGKGILARMFEKAFEADGDLDPGTPDEPKRSVATKPPA